MASGFDDERYLVFFSRSFHSSTVLYNAAVNKRPLWKVPLGARRCGVKGTSKRDNNDDATFEQIRHQFVSVFVCAHTNTTSNSHSRAHALAWFQALLSFSASTLRPGPVGEEIRPKISTLIESDVNLLPWTRQTENKKFLLRIRTQKQIGDSFMLCFVFSVLIRFVWNALRNDGCPVEEAVSRIGAKRTVWVVFGGMLGFTIRKIGLGDDLLFYSSLVFSSVYSTKCSGEKPRRIDFSDIRNSLARNHSIRRQPLLQSSQFSV